MKKWTTNLLTAGIIICMGISLAACGSIQKTGKTGSENQQSAQSQSGKEAGNNKTTVAAGQNMEWPKEKMANLTEPKANVTAIVKDDTTKQCTVAFGEMSEADAKAYILKLKELGYVNNVVEMTDANSVMFSGESSSGEQVTFIYNISTKDGTIFYDPKGKGTSSISISKSVDMTDAAAWPANFIPGVPELNGKITDVVNDNNKTTTVYLDYVEKAAFEAYVKQLKQNGYTVEVDESTSVTSVDFRAYNAAREWVHAYLNIEQDRNSATIEMEKASE